MRKINIIFHSYVEAIFFLNKRNALIYKLMVTKGEYGGAGGRNKSEPWDEHTDTLLYIRYITNKDLLYITWNSTQNPGITYMRKKSEMLKVFPPR